MIQIQQKITPHLWFDTQAKEAVDFYCSVFPDSAILSSVRIQDTPSGNCDFLVFKLCGQEFMAISAGPYFKFNEAISLVVNCDTQDEIDYYWGKLSAVPEAEQCGWCKDKYGLSWQITPSIMAQLMSSGDTQATKRVTQAFLKMKKFDIATLQKAFAEN